MMEEKEYCEYMIFWFSFVFEYLNSVLFFKYISRSFKCKGNMVRLALLVIIKFDLDGRGANV